MRSFPIAGLLVVSLVACRRSSTPTPTPSASALASAAPAVSSAPVVVAPPRYASPIAAALRGDEVIVAGGRRGGGVTAGRHALAGGGSSVIELPPLDVGKPDDVDWIVAPSFVGLVVDIGPSVTGLFARDVGALSATSWAAADSGACVAGGRVVSIARADGGIALVSRDENGPVAGAAVPPGLASSLVCSPRGPVLVVDEGNQRVLRLAAEPPAQITLPDEDDEHGFWLAPTPSGELVAVRLGAHGLALRSWGTTLGAWQRSSAKIAKDATLELAVATDSFVAIVLSRPVPSSRSSCDESDAVAELWVLDRATAEARREGERLERWGCGAEPGPFWGGIAGSSVVVSWPRGASTACARLGVRWGGLGWAATKGGPVKVTHEDAPADDFADAGCEGARCVVVALSRAKEGTCFAASDIDAGDVGALVLSP